ncbi:histidinol dehydrogenase [candidate division KSB1 bacterium]
MKELKNKNDLMEFWNGSFENIDDTVSENVRKIISGVRKNNDKALFDLTEKYDGVRLHKLRVDPAKIVEAFESFDSELKRAFEQAAFNIREFHSGQLPGSWSIGNQEKIYLGQKYSPIESVGIYVPGGKAVYPSTLLMNCIPAQVAGVERIVIVSPPGKDGKISSVILACAGLLGIDEVYSIGGAQSIAALAYGTESIDPVVKITGPGNKYVNEAKLQVFGKVGIDMPAGPTELIIAADSSSRADYIAWDLTAQAEHDPDAKTLLITDSMELAENVRKRLGEIADKTERTDIVKASLLNNSGLYLVADISESVEYINDLAPEHLEIMTEKPFELSKKIRNAGAIFVGEYTPNAVGDYWAGPNHTLPTSGAAKFSSPLNVLDFMKFSSVIGYSKKSLREVSGSINKMAQSEKLFAHGRSVEVRNE